jgi:hypothetical protein
MTSNRVVRPLLTPVSAYGAWHEVAIIGGSREDDGALAAGFIKAAEVLVEHWETHRPNDLLVLPILANYRHGIELALKDGIRTAAVCAARDGVDEPALDPGVLDTDLASTHSIGRLVKMLTAVLDQLELGEARRLPPDVLELLQSLHVFDESGQSFRYATVKVGSGRARKLVPARPDQVSFDLSAVAAVLHNAATILLNGVSGVLEYYSRYQDDMQDQRDEYASYYDYPN